METLAAQWIKDNPVPPGIFKDEVQKAVETYAMSAFMSGAIAAFGKA